MNPANVLFSAPTSSIPLKKDIIIKIIMINKKTNPEYIQLHLFHE
jgi:hypothetical protein